MAQGKQRRVPMSAARAISPGRLGCAGVEYGRGRDGSVDVNIDIGSIGSIGRSALALDK